MNAHVPRGRLQDKVAIVTGAGAVGPGWGNGRATAVRFAQEGATVFALDLAKLKSLLEDPDVRRVYLGDEFRL